jgi:hypothetical protein
MANETIEVTPAEAPPKFVPSTADLPQPMDDNAVRAIFAEAAKQGIEDLGSTVTIPAPNGQPIDQRVQEIQPPKIEVPAKFQKPDGTADEEKIKASSAQLDEAIKKVEPSKTVEEVLAEYREKEKAFKAKTMELSQPPAPPPPPPTVQQGQLDPNMQAVRNQLLQLQQTDPIAFAVEIARAVSRKEAADIAGPALEVAQNIREQNRDGMLRTNIAKIAESDPRFLQLYGEVTKELESDPNYYTLKNPHKAAWNEVKERMRLGEPPVRAAQAQPTMNPSLTLRGGSPTPVSQLSQPQTEASLFQQAQTVNPYSEEGKRLEDKMREMSRLGPGGW